MKKSNEKFDLERYALWAEMIGDYIDGRFMSGPIGLVFLRKEELKKRPYVDEYIVYIDSFMNDFDKDKEEFFLERRCLKQLKEGKVLSKKGRENLHPNMIRFYDHVVAGIPKDLLKK